MRPGIEKPEHKTRRLELTGLARPAIIHLVTGMGTGLAHQDTVGWAL